MELLYTRTLPVLPEEGPEGRRPPPPIDVYLKKQKETRRVAEPNRAHPVRDKSVSCPQHIPNRHMTTVSYIGTTTAETAYNIEIKVV